MSIRFLSNHELATLLVTSRQIASVYTEFNLTVPDDLDKQIGEVEGELLTRAQAERQNKIMRLQARLQGLKTRGELRAEVEAELSKLLGE